MKNTQKLLRQLQQEFENVVEIVKEKIEIFAIISEDMIIDWDVVVDDPDDIDEYAEKYLKGLDYEIEYDDEDTYIELYLTPEEIKDLATRAIRKVAKTLKEKYDIRIRINRKSTFYNPYKRTINIEPDEKLFPKLIHEIRHHYQHKALIIADIIYNIKDKMKKSILGLEEMDAATWEIQAVKHLDYGNEEEFLASLGEIDQIMTLEEFTEKVKEIIKKINIERYEQVYKAHYIDR